MSSKSILISLLAISSFSAPVPGTAAEQLPDLWNIIPAEDMKIVPTDTGLEFRYTHNIANAGPGPLEIQPNYNEASGNYQGFQHIYSLDADQWSISRKIRIAGAFEFHAEHGHFHYPLAAFGLYSVAPDGSAGAPVALSPKIGFCIGNSFAYDKTLPNFGVFSNQGPCTDPSSLRGIAVGYVDNYDYHDEGQSIALPVNPATKKPGLPDGTYWFRAISDPNNFLVENNEKNNITDIKIVIKDNAVIQTFDPVFPDSTPPDIVMISPQDGDHLFGTISLRANARATGNAGVQYLLDGAPLGKSTQAPNYPFAWDTTTVTNGTHWLAAQITDASRRTGTSPVVVVLPAAQGEKDATVPTITLTQPKANSTVSGIVEVGATATDDRRVAHVQFFVDGKPLGSPVTHPPFMTRWNTKTAAGGSHVLTASATDAAGQTGNTDNAGRPAKQTVTVDNSAPLPDVIGKEVVVVQEGPGALTTPPFSTTTAGDLLVAFVAYDGPANQAQTAAVSGSGLNWQLVKRSNTQGGTAEIWSARAPGILTNATVTSAPEKGSFDGSLIVVAFTHAAGIGIQGVTGGSSGAPDISLPGIAAGNWVWAVGNDWSGATARKPVPGQVLVYQGIDTAAGNTFWVQSTSAPSDALGLVNIHDSEPTGNHWNYAAVEIIATRGGSRTGAGLDASFDGTMLTLPVVKVGNQNYRVTLRITPLKGSPTGYGFVLDSAVPTTASSGTAATYDPKTGQLLLHSVTLMSEGVSQGSGDARLKWVAGSAPMLFALESPNLPNFSPPAVYSSDSGVMTLPVVNVGSQKYRATLRLIPLEGSPTGYGFKLDSAELTTVSSNTAATFNSATGQIDLPEIRLIQNGARMGQTTVSFKMELVAGSDPLVFKLTRFPPINEKPWQ
jgi:hypothetical protein